MQAVDWNVLLEIATRKAELNTRYCFRSSTSRAGQPRAQGNHIYLDQMPWCIVSYRRCRLLVVYTIAFGVI